MKILGKRSLSSGLKIALMIFLWIAVLMMVCSSVYVAVDLDFIVDSFLLGGVMQVISMSILLVYLTEFPATILVFQFMKIFGNLENGRVFDRVNTNKLRNSYICSFVIASVYFFLLVLAWAIFGNDMGMLMWNFVAPIILCITFIIFGTGLLVLTKIYERAVQYKEENDLTI